ncbi:hypothetical protein CPB86DRAFT_817993 [Serendipita vermifera]|nr:hypothetical protein CPB86DRAFT_817993 [Serendipita vermifera]
MRAPILLLLTAAFPSLVSAACTWTACNAEACPDRFPEELAVGTGGCGRPACSGEIRFCCDNKPPLDGCGWYDANQCQQNCPSGKRVVTQDSSAGGNPCPSGRCKKFCCDNTVALLESNNDESMAISDESEQFIIQSLKDAHV